MAALSQMELEVKRERVRDSVAKRRAASRTSAVDVQHSQAARFEPESGWQTLAKRLPKSPTTSIYLAPLRSTQPSSAIRRRGAKLKGQNPLDRLPSVPTRY